MGLNPVTALNISFNPSNHALSVFGWKLMKGGVEMKSTLIVAASLGTWISACFSYFSFFLCVFFFPRTRKKSPKIESFSVKIKWHQCCLVDSWPVACSKTPDCWCLVSVSLHCPASYLESVSLHFSTLYLVLTLCWWTEVWCEHCWGLSCAVESFKTGGIWCCAS